MKLAIIIPVYNAAKTVGKTLASLQQIEQGWEHVDQVVVCDDASKDDSLQVIQQTHFDRCPLRVLRHEVNKGQEATCATLITSLSDNMRWFLILHSDDLALPNFLIRNLEILKSCPENVASVSSNYWVLDPTGERLATAESDDVIFRAGTDEDIQHTAQVGCWWHISGALVNKDRWLEFGRTDGSIFYCADWDLVLKWQLHGYVVGHSLIATTKYRECLNTSVSSSSYLTCRDLRDRTKVALGLPEIFHGRTKWIFAFSILKAALRRCFKFLVHLKTSRAVNAFKVGIGSFLKLIASTSSAGCRPGKNN